MGRVGLLLLELMGLLKGGLLLLLQQFLRILFLLATSFWLLHWRRGRLHRRYVEWSLLLGLMMVISAVRRRRSLLIPASGRRVVRHRGRHRVVEDLLQRRRRRGRRGDDPAGTLEHTVRRRWHVLIVITGLGLIQRGQRCQISQCRIHQRRRRRSAKRFVPGVEIHVGLGRRLMMLLLLLLNARSLIVRTTRRSSPTLIDLRLMSLLLGLLMMLRHTVRIGSAHIVGLIRVRHHLLLIVPTHRSSPVTHLTNVLRLSTRKTPREGHRSRPIKHVERLTLADRNVHRIAVRHRTHQFKHLLLLAGLLLGHLHRRRLVAHVHRHFLLLLLLLLLLQLLTLAAGTALVTATVVAQIDKLRYFDALVRLPNVLLLLLLFVRLAAIVGRVRVVAQQVAQMTVLLVL